MNLMSLFFDEEPVVWGLSLHGGPLDGETGKTNFPVCRSQFTNLTVTIATAQFGYVLSSKDVVYVPKRFDHGKKFVKFYWRP